MNVHLRRSQYFVYGTQGPDLARMHLRALPRNKEGGPRAKHETPGQGWPIVGTANRYLADKLATCPGNTREDNLLTGKRRAAHGPTINRRESESATGFLWAVLLLQFWILPDRYFPVVVYACFPQGICSRKPVNNKL